MLSRNAMTIRPISIDARLKNTLSGAHMKGRALSVHDEAIYLLEDKGRMLVFVREEVGNGPCFIVLRGNESFMKAPLLFRPGEQFAATGMKVDVGRGRVIVDVADAAEWDPRPSLSHVSGVGAIEASVGHAAKIVGSRGVGKGLEPLLGKIDTIFARDHDRLSERMNPLLEGALPMVRRLAGAIARGSVREVTDAAVDLIGLGDGLTPSCDDMLVGMAGFFHGMTFLSGHGETARDIISRLGEAIEKRGNRTTPVSRHFLSEAAGGRFTERVKALLDGIFSADEKRVEWAARRVLEYGATSGVDLVFGIVLACKTAIRGSRQNIDESQKL